MSIHPHSVTSTKVFELKSIMSKCLITMIILLLLDLSACSQLSLQPTPSPDVLISTTTIEIFEPDPSASLTLSDSGVQETPTPTILTQANDSPLIRQGAAYGFLNPFQVDDVATGEYQVDKPDCGSVWLNGMFEDDGETELTLQYVTPLVVDHVEIYAASLPIRIKRIELLNSFSGLGTLLDLPADASWDNLGGDGACAKHLIISTDIDFEVDTVLIEFFNLTSAIQVESVELFGELVAFDETPIYWRVPLISTPVDIAMGQNGMVHVITEPNNLLTYDVEGNQLKQFSVPVESFLTSVTTDSLGNMVVTDSTYEWFITLSPDGEQLSTGIDDSSFPKTAINPRDGNLYLLTGNKIRIYSADSAKLVSEISFDDIHAYTSLAFSNDGMLFTIRDFNWDATLLTIDPLTGEELDAIPLINSNFNEFVARDIAVDKAGNIYILFSVNTGQIAIHMLDPQGTLKKRFGLLSSDPLEWPEGSFLDPTAIAVSPDGRFVIVADGFDEESYLSAFLMEIDESQD